MFFPNSCVPHVIDSCYIPLLELKGSSDVRATKGTFAEWNTERHPTEAHHQPRPVEAFPRGGKLPPELPQDETVGVQKHRARAVCPWQVSLPPSLYIYKE